MAIDSVEDMKILFDGAGIIQYTSQAMPKFNSISPGLGAESTPCRH